MGKELTKKEIKQRKKQAYSAWKESEKLLVDFGFSLNYTNKIRGTQTVLKIDNSNFALAFHPYIWSKIDLAHKIAVSRVAYKQIHHKDIKEFVNYNSNGFVMCGKNYDGALNLGAFFREDTNCIELFQKICQGESLIKESYYFNKAQGKNYNKISDFDSFEEMQYLSPLEFKQDFDSLSDIDKAYYLDKISLRNYRQDLQRSIDYLCGAFIPLRDFSDELYDYFQKETDNILKTNLFIMQQLGSSSLERDEKYLDIKVELFNQGFIEEFNKKAEEHNIKLEEYKKVAKEYNNLVEEYNNPSDAISQVFTKHEIDAMRPTLDKVKAELSDMKTELDKIETNIITLNDAEEHFKEHFKKDKELQNTGSNSKTNFFNRRDSFYMNTSNGDEDKHNL